MFVGFLFVIKACLQKILQSQFGLRSIQNINPVLLLKGKKNKEQGISELLERHNRDLFSLLFVCVPFNFFIPSAELRQPQIKAIHATSHMMIKSDLAVLKMDR